MKAIYIMPFIFFFLSCNDNDNGQTNNEGETANDVTIPLSVYQKIYKTTSDIYIDGGFVYISTNGVPDHKSPYFLGTEWENEKYAGYDGSNPFVTNFNLNPNRISALSLTFKIPIRPRKGNGNNPTRMGEIGVSLNGVPFYNQYAGMNQPLTREVNSFDQYNGHPAPMGTWTRKWQKWTLSLSYGTFLAYSKSRQGWAYWFPFGRFSCIWTSRKR